MSKEVKDFDKIVQQHDMVSHIRFKRMAYDYFKNHQRFVNDDLEKMVNIVFNIKFLRCDYGPVYQ
jgi:hypothetical protein